MAYDPEVCIKAARMGVSGPPYSALPAKTIGCGSLSSMLPEQAALPATASSKATQQ